MYRANFARLVAALRINGLSEGDAEETVQEAFGRTFERWNRVSRGTNPIGYVYRVAIRLSWRRQRDVGRISVAATDTSLTTGDSGTTEVINALSVQEALGKLPDRQRQCVVLCAMFGFSSKTAGEILGIDAGTVRSNVHDARGALERDLGPKSPEAGSL